MQKENEEREKKPIPEILMFMLQQLNYKAHDKEAVLQCEESGSKVANLQGFLAGVREYKTNLRNNGWEFDIKYDGTEERKIPYFNDDGCSIELFELRGLISDIDELTDTADWESFKELWQDAVDWKKDWLFFNSEKGRDLHFAKGWYEAMRTIDNTIERLHREFEEAEKKAAESLPFDDGEI